MSLSSVIVVANALRLKAGRQETPGGAADRSSASDAIGAGRMSSLIFLVPLALLLGGAALGAFLWSLRSGQYDDLDGAAERILLDDDRE